MSYELEGSIKFIGDTQSFGAKGFTKREIVVTTSADRYPQDIKLEFVKEKTSLLDNFSAGQSVKVSFDLRGGEYNGKYFVNLTGWRIDPAGAGAPNDAPRSSSGGRPQGGGGGGGGRAPQQPAKSTQFSEDDFNNQSRDEYPF